MSDIDLMAAARGAVFRAMNEGASVQLAPVFTEVPENTQPNYFMIGDIDSDDASAKGDDDREQLQIEIISVYRGEDRGVLLAMMNAARRDLRRQPISAPGALLRPPRWVGSSASSALADGVTYIGLSHFTIQAQPA